MRTGRSTRSQAANSYMSIRVKTKSRKYAATDRVGVNNNSGGRRGQHE